MHKKILLIIVFCFSIYSFRNDEPILNESDLSVLSGTKWNGKLTYLDYSSKKEVSIPVTLTVSQSSVDKNTFIFQYAYTNEPDANNADTIMIKDNGKYFGNEKIISCSHMLNNTLEVVTEEAGEDDDRPAMFRHIYLISDSNFSIKKEVKFNDESEFFKRNVYEFKR